jgi:hypothetical protein
VRAPRGSALVLKRIGGDGVVPRPPRPRGVRAGATALGYANCWQGRDWLAAVVAVSPVAGGDGAVAPEIGL